MAGHRITYFVTTSSYDSYYANLRDLFFAVIFTVYDTRVSTTRGDIYHNIIVNHLVRSYCNLVN